MRAFDVTGVGLALLLVPLYAWLLGRFAGRRDWRIGTLLMFATALVLLVQLAIVGGQAFIEAQTSAVGKDYTFLLARRATEVVTNPEFPVFLIILGAFITMLGWSSTPVKKSNGSVVA